MNTNNNHSTDTTHNAGFPPATPQASPSSSGGKVFVVEIEDSDGNDGTYEVEAANERIARFLASATHDNECGHGAHMWVVSCEEQE